MLALKDFRYLDQATRQSIQITAGQDVDADTLRKNKCDLEKLRRTNFVEFEETRSDPSPRKRRVRQGK
jgi:hypothetical protein